MTSDTMRDLFFIMKGQYSRGVGECFTNPVTNEKSYIGGYDPNSVNTQEWYALMDTKTYHCIACGSDLNKVLNAVRTVIVKHKGVAKSYFKRVSDTTSDDYYEVHYLGKAPLTPEERSAKAEGRCPRVSPVMRCIYEKVFEEYGDYFRDQIEEMEDLAYEDLKERRPLSKAKRLVAKTSKPKTQGEVLTPSREVEVTKKTTITPPKARLGFKKI